MPVIIVRDDVSEAISREIQFQRGRGMVVTRIDISPEVHEYLRKLHKAPLGAVLTEHDEVPVRIERRFSGLKQWVVRTAVGAQVKELQIDAARQAGFTFAAASRNSVIRPSS